MQNLLLFLRTNSKSLAEARKSQAVKDLVLQHQNFSVRRAFQILTLGPKYIGKYNLSPTP